MIESKSVRCFAIDFGSLTKEMLMMQNGSSMGGRELLNALEFFSSGE